MFNGSLKWWLCAAAALLLSWRVVSVNVAQYQATTDNPSVTTWNVDIPDILLIQAVQAIESDPAKARHLALRAAWGNPADGRAFLIMALLWEQQGKLDMAKKAIAIVDFLTPRRAENQLQVGNFWARQGDLVRALPHWSVAMQMNPDFTQALFPQLLRIAEVPGYRPAFTQLAGDPPAWWDDFFLYAIHNAIQLDTLKAIYLALEKSAKGPGRIVRKAYLDRLMLEGMWTEAYFVWMNSLDADQLLGLGNLYDGGFEYDTPDAGYGWRFATGNTFTLDAQTTYGATGEKALRVEFLGSRLPTLTLAEQFLMLDPGQYQLSGRFRIDSLKAARGMYWVLSCATGKTLAQSEYFQESAPWKGFALGFQVPSLGCEAQKIELMMDPADARRSDLSGIVWFDDVAISLVR